MSDVEAMVAWLNGVLDEDELVAHAAGGRNWGREDYGCVVDAANNGLIVYSEGTPSREQADHIARNDPAHVLNVVAAHRAIIDEVMSWRHFYLDEDGWYSCAQAVDPSESDAEPGSGCIDGDRAGKPCDCGLDRRRQAILGPLAAGYADRDGYKAEWGQW